MDNTYFKNLDDNTKKICAGSFISMFLIIVFIISPLSSFVMTSFIIKILILVILAYSIYLNLQQSKHLQNYADNISQEMKAQININMVCGYIFTGFLGLLFIFVIKSFF